MKKATKKMIEEMRRVKRFVKNIKIKKIIFPLIFVFSLPVLTGCSAMRSKFDCNVTSGGRCASMKQINKMADHGAFQDNGSQKTRKTKLSRLANQFTGYPLNTFAGAPIRRNESIQQIWIGPYEDTNGNYHEPSYVYTVIKKGRWIGEPASVIQD